MIVNGHEINLFSLISGYDMIRLSKQLAKAIGVKNAILYAELAEYCDDERDDGTYAVNIVNFKEWSLLTPDEVEQGLVDLECNDLIITDYPRNPNFITVRFPR